MKIIKNYCGVQELPPYKNITLEQALKEDVGFFINNMPILSIKQINRIVKDRMNKFKAVKNMSWEEFADLITETNTWSKEFNTNLSLGVLKKKGYLIKSSKSSTK